MTDRIRDDAASRPARVIAMKVSGIYALATTVWILGSGYVVMMLPDDVARYLEIYKGLAFGVVTTVLLYIVIHAWAERFANQVRVADVAEHRLLQVLKAVPAGVMLTDASGVIEFVNPEAVRILGLSESVMIGNHIEEVVYVTEVKSARVMDLLESGRLDGVSIQGRTDTPNNAFVASAARLESVSDHKGWVLAFTDVTGTHVDNKRIRRLVQGYRVISDVLNRIQTARDTRQLLVAVCETLVGEGLISGVWAAARGAVPGNIITVSHSGLSDEMVEMLERTATDRSDDHVSAVRESLRAGHLHIDNDVRDDQWSPLSALDDESQPFGSLAAFAVVAHGEPLAMLVFFAESPGFFDQEQIRLVEMLRDAIVFAVSKFELEEKRLEAEEALANSESAYREMFMQSPAPMWVYDRSTLAFLAVNDAAVRKYGYSADEFSKMTIIDIRPPEDIPRLLHSVAHHTAGQEGSGYWTHIDRSGHTFAVFVQSNSINWNGIDAQLVLVQEVATVG